MQEAGIGALDSLPRPVDAYRGGLDRFAFLGRQLVAGGRDPLVQEPVELVDLGGVGLDVGVVLAAVFAELATLRLDHRAQTVLLGLALKRDEIGALDGTGHPFGFLLDAPELRLLK